ncbi:hypothetical protein SAMN04487943_110116 [Gracilibacillus orientalis]|uniref:Uncharacterized protein n=1 Tax=Gracilibacillus orientalis TaxID=334253 RepID=A0A1I4P7S5_9BACI|nr:hypothetical protein [Gracilibacillus orientalis]SFM23656.1 hypothetical protein SAMN04487943_110116 [Gracilibacillus orientalis]
MKIVLNNDQKSLMLDNTNNIKAVIQAVNKLIGTELILSHLIIDDQTIYIDYETYIGDHLKDIHVINVIGRTKPEFINETLLTAETYLENSFTVINKLIDQLLKQPSDDTWKTFTQLTDGIQWLTDIIFMIDRMEERPTNWQAYVEVYHQLEENVAELADALDNQDTILIADVINYEIKAIFETLIELITNTIDQEGSRPNAN